MTKQADLKAYVALRQAVASNRWWPCALPEVRLISPTSDPWATLEIIAK
jgi:hypothetical protein